VNIDEMREYVRYSTDIAIGCQVPNLQIEGSPRMRNISQTGLCFTTKSCVQRGNNIHLTIPVNGVDFEVDGTVMRCHDMEVHYEMGVKFNDDRTESSIQMIDQLCQIEQYRSDVKTKEGREMTSEEAGKEWAEKFG